MDGIFLDETTTGCDQACYADLHRCVEQHDEAEAVVLNSRTGMAECCVAAADVLVDSESGYCATELSPAVRR